MVLWWIANALVLLVVVPLVIVLANRTIAQAREVARYADDILTHGVGITAALEPLPALAETGRLVAQASEHAVAYVQALDRRT
jgi:integral membrane sensor domain MASE1